MRPKSVVAQRGDQSLWIEHGLVFEHEVNGACQLDGQHGVGFEFVAIHLCFQSLAQRPDEGVVAFGDHGRFAEGPAQIGVAQFGAAQAFDLAGAGDRDRKSVV